MYAFSGHTSHTRALPTNCLPPSRVRFARQHISILMLARTMHPKNKKAKHMIRRSAEPFKEHAAYMSCEDSFVKKNKALSWGNAGRTVRGVS